MSSSRRAGILLHPTSLPGRFGIGDFGPEADHFLNWLQRAGQSVWQVLPLGPPAFGGAPYTCFSAFAGNPALISPEGLAHEGWVSWEDVDSVPHFEEGKSAFGEVEGWKEGLLRRAWEHFRSLPEDDRGEFFAFCGAEEQRSWLEDWVLFSALKKRMDGRSWTDWDAPFAHRHPEALDQIRAEDADELNYHRFLQFVFYRQWNRVRHEASNRGIRIMGDIPIYVAQDSADVWANRHLFDLNEHGHANNVAGVPPDYFAETGQLWGNPLYRWDRIAEDGYRWWIDRLRANLRQADSMRLDHFRAFAGYWSVPAHEETAINGHWETGPGRAFFDAVSSALGSLPLVAEDLGEITDDVHELRRGLGLPGMRVLHFGFEPDPNIHTPHQLEPNMVIYTGTHDNDTTVGWYQAADEGTRERFGVYTGAHPDDAHWAMIRAAHGSVAELALVPAQDVLGLETSARMNVPGVADGNWGWRLRSGELRDEHADRLRRLTEVCERRA